MAETGQDITIFAGNDVSIELTLYDAAGDALDLTGATLEWGMATLRATEATLLKTSADAAEIEITDAEGGLATVYLDAVDTAVLGGTYRHEVRMVGTSGATTLLTGAVTIKASILDE